MARVADDFMEAPVTAAPVYAATVDHRDRASRADVEDDGDVHEGGNGRFIAIAPGPT